MAGEFGLLSEEVFAEKLDTQNALLARIAAAQGTAITDYKTLQMLCRRGLASTVLSVGDQIGVTRGSETIVFDVIGFDHDTPADPQFTHSITLQMHDCMAGTQYSAPQAMYYAETELAAGTYNVTPATGWSGGMGNGKTYQFTLTKSVPAGGQIVWNGAYDKDPLNYKIYTYSGPTSTAVIETATPTVGSDGTALTTLNTAQRMCCGSNNWQDSAMRQWLNSSAAAGSVWTPKTNYDRPPSWASSSAGLLNGMDDEFLSILGKCTKRTAKNTVNEGGGYTDTEDLFFLLSRSEIFAGVEVSGVDEGAVYPYYQNYSDYTAANAGADSNRIKYRSNAAQWWWLRTPNAGYTYGVRLVYTAGQLHSHDANYAYGVAAACNIV